MQRSSGSGSVSDADMRQRFTIADGERAQFPRFQMHRLPR
jgi:hypothetical protein